MKILYAFLMLFLSFNSLANISPKEAYAMMQNGEAVIIDIREEHEVALGMIPGAVWFPLSRTNEASSWIEEFNELTGTKKIFLYCRSGNRVEILRKKLTEFKIEAVNLGGYEALKAALFP